MSTTYHLKLANREVYRLFTRKIQGDRLFYAAVIQKIQALKRQASASAEAGNILQGIHQRILNLCHEFYDDVDALEGALEKNQHIGDLDFQFSKPFEVTVNFDSAPAAALVELFSIYDRLLSLLKVQQVTGFFREETFATQIKPYLKQVNQLLSHALLLKSDSTAVL